MFNKKKIIFIVVSGLIGLLFFVLVIISAFTRNGSDQLKTQITPTPEQIIIPTSSIGTDNENPTNSNTQLQLIATDPQDGSLDLTPITQISFTFSEQINERKFYYKTNPQTSSLISTSDKTITITPKDVWPVGQNSITVYAETESTLGKQLSTPFTYSFVVQEIPFPDEEFNE